MDAPGDRGIHCAHIPRKQSFRIQCTILGVYAHLVEGEVTAEMFFPF